MFRTELSDEAKIKNLTNALVQLLIRVDAKGEREVYQPTFDYALAVLYATGTDAKIIMRAQ